VLSPGLVYAGNAVEACAAAGCEAAINAFVLEGKMLGTGADSGIVGGDTICCDARREVGVPVTRGDCCEIGRGDGGTELRSGAMVVARRVQSLEGATCNGSEHSLVHSRGMLKLNNIKDC
jgi:hypothetical protein